MILFKKNKKGKFKFKFEMFILINFYLQNLELLNNIHNNINYDNLIRDFLFAISVKKKKKD